MSLRSRFFLMLLLAAAPATAQPHPTVAGFRGDPAEIAQPVRDTLRALVVLVKFRDDDVVGDPVVDFRRWPLFDDPAQLPDFARHLLASAPTWPFPDSSLTAYFYQQSDGNFLIYGDVLDSVMVSLEDEAAYHRPEGGYGFLTVEILDRLDAAGFDFSRYDHNEDGHLDYLFLLIRGDSQRDARRFAYTGISCLDARCGGGLSGGRPRPTLTYDGLAIDWNRDGSIILHRTPGNILPHYYHVRVMAHELGHDLYQGLFNHLPPIRDNEVPATGNRPPPDRTAGYVLMAGAGGALDGRGDETLSAHERDLLGWIRCRRLQAPQDDVRLGDLYTTGDCVKIPLDGEAAGHVLYVANRQRLGAFDRRRRGGRDGRFEMGLLRTTGLVVHLAAGVYADVLPADNSMDLSAADGAYQGDLFGPGTPQLTPWTRPNTSGYTHYPAGRRPSWQALDRIRYTGGPGGEMTFDYVEDFRERPVIRRPSWMGDEVAGYVFTAPIVVTEAGRLHVEGAVTAGAGLRVEAGAEVVVEPGGILEVPPGAVLDLRWGAVVIVEGELRLAGLVRRSPEARLVTREAGRILIGE